MWLQKLLRSPPYPMPKIDSCPLICQSKSSSIGHKPTSSKNSLNAATQMRPYLQFVRDERTFRAGDKVMQVQNNYDREVFNGDIGRIDAIDTDEQALVVDYDGRPVEYEFSDLDELQLAYACTIHKSQGSEYPAVVIPLTTQHYMLLERNLVYTAITRGKKLVVVVGNRRALQLASERMQSRLRYTALARRIKSYSTDREVLTGVKDPYGDD